MTFLNRAHRVAIICGASPLLLGTAIFVTWLVARWDWLMIAGVVVLYGGLAVVAAGVVALALSCWMAVRTQGVPRRRVWVSTLGCAGLLLANFLAAGGIMSAVIAIATHYTSSFITPRHSGSMVCGYSVVDATLRTGPSFREPQRGVSFWIRQQGVLVFGASGGEEAIEQTIDDYGTNDLGGHVRITVQRDQTISVTRVPKNQLPLVDRARDVVFWRDRSFCERSESTSWNQTPADTAMEPSALSRS